MKVAIVGYGVEGVSAYKYWKNLGADITICDQDPAKLATIPDGVSHRLGSDYLKNLDSFELIVRSPGIRPDTILAENPQVQDKITTVIDEFLRVCPTKNVVGITGTKGKGTTSTLITKMLAAAGKEVYLGGNIGQPPLDFLPQLNQDSWVVLELSSFQLIDIKKGTHIAVCLMVAAEHLNWHTDIDEYIKAKVQLFAHQTVQDFAIYLAASDWSQQIASASPGTKIPYFASPGAHVERDSIVIDNQSICRIDELKLLGEHNLQNVCAALTAVWQITQDVEAIRSVLTTFSGLEHRLELVREVNDVRYYDDSFGTTPDTAIVAIRAFDEPKVVVLGGSDKGASYDELAKVVKNANVRRVILIGNDQNPLHKTAAPDIESALSTQGFDAITTGGPTMRDIVQACHDAAQSGDVVLLSPACASFDMFKDYKDRAQQFKQAVNALPEVP